MVARRNRRLKAIIVVAALLASGVFIPAGGFAEVKTTVELETLGGFSMIDANTPAAIGNARAEISFEASGNRNVRSEVKLTATVGETVYFDVSRAYIKTRLPGFRLTLGKSTVSWGEGFAFNAGDVIFPDIDITGSFTSVTLRGRSTWIALGYIPLGRFSFIEVIAVPPPVDIMRLAAGDPDYTLPPLWEGSAGGRIYLTPGNLRVETGYLLRGAEETHNPYVSLQWNLFFDMHLSSTAAIPHFTPTGEDILESWDITAGLSRIESFRGGGSLTVRLEALVQPGQNWSEQPGSDAEYGLLLYPEVSWGITETVSTFVRSVFSPLDFSAFTTLGASWNVYQGLDVIGYFSFQLGEAGDLYGWSKPGWLALSAGLRYIY
ncbi:MAG: hypothetical protein ACLFRY_11625 [Spirochaetia bacterium]